MTLTSLSNVLYGLEWLFFVFLVLFPLRPALDTWGQERTVLVAKCAVVIIVVCAISGMVIAVMQNNWWDFSSCLLPILIIAGFLEDDWRKRCKRVAKQLGEKSKAIRDELVRNVKERAREPVPIPVPVRN